MLYIKMSPLGHCLNDKWSDPPITHLPCEPVSVMLGSKWSKTPIVPYLSNKELGNGCYDLGLVHEYDTQKFALTPGNTTIWILSQDKITPWTNTFDIDDCYYYGRQRGGVIAHRLMGTDIVIYELPVDGWFVSDKTVYHNDGGVLLRFPVKEVIGWKTWNHINTRYYSKDAIEFHKVSK